MSTDTHTGNKENKSMPENWRAKLSLSHWLAIVAIPIGIVGACYLFWNEEKTRVNVYVLARELPAYYLIKPDDLVQKSYSFRSVPSGILKTSQEIVGRYTLTELPKYQPLTNSQLGVPINSACLSDNIAVSLPATPAMTLGGNLKSGDIISITFGSPSPQKGVSPTTLFLSILVLDVKALPQANTSFTSVIVISLPKQLIEKFATHVASDNILVGRSLSAEANSCFVKIP
jgi:Flp pilus assembly protein CpaB